MGVKREEQVIDDGAMGFTMDELVEFLEADLLDVSADPEFKERLRKSLWEMLSNDPRRRKPGDEGL